MPQDGRSAIAAYDGIPRRGDSISSVLVNLGELVRSRRQYALAESLNVAALLVRSIVVGPTPDDLVRLEGAIAQVPFRDLPMIDRPYLRSLAGFARIGADARRRLSRLSPVETWRP